MALLAAAAAPAKVRSLTVIEPPAFSESLSLDPTVAAFREHLLSMWSDRTSSDSDWIRRFVAKVDPHQPPPPDDVVATVLPFASSLRHATRPVTEIELPVASIRDARIPCLVVSGGQNAAFETLCDVVAARLDARREVVRGAGHCVQYTRPAFNDTLEAFLNECGP